MTLENAYLLLSALMTIILFYLGLTGISTSSLKVPRRKRADLLLLLVGLIGWHVYIFLMSRSGIFTDLSFPPKFALFLILPAFLFTGLFILRHRKKKWIQSIPPHWLIFYQSFRVLIESLFVWSVAKNILHPNVTIEGYNYDMIFGLTALFLGGLYWKNPHKWTKVVRAWNILGLVVIAGIIFLFMTTIYVPEMYGPNVEPFPTAFTGYPYVLVAGFLMPSAVFIHVLSHFQLKTLAA